MQNQIPLLNLQSVSFWFARQKDPFFKELSLSFNPGAIHFIKGQNGAGKSTFFHLLQGMLTSHERVNGTITFDGIAYTCHGSLLPIATHELGSKIKRVQQAFDLMLADNLTFEQNLRIAHFPEYPGLTPLPPAPQIPSFVSRFGIDINKPVYCLSGGQRQILAILMALQKPTKLLLLDEPTAALDQKNARMVMEFLDELVKKDGLTIMIICHDRDLLESYAVQGYYEIIIDPQDQSRSMHFVKRS